MVPRFDGGGGFSFMVLLYENTKKVGPLNIYSNTKLSCINSP